MDFLDGFATRKRHLELIIPCFIVSHPIDLCTLPPCPLIISLINVICASTSNIQYLILA